MHSLSDAGCLLSQLLQYHARVQSTPPVALVVDRSFLNEDIVSYQDLCRDPRVWCRPLDHAFLSATASAQSVSSETDFNALIDNLVFNVLRKNGKNFYI